MIDDMDKFLFVKDLLNSDLKYKVLIREISFTDNEKEVLLQAKKDFSSSTKDLSSILKAYVILNKALSGTSTSVKKLEVDETILDAKDNIAVIIMCGVFFFMGLYGLSASNINYKLFGFIHSDYTSLFLIFIGISIYIKQIGLDVIKQLKFDKQGIEIKRSKSYNYYAWSDIRSFEEYSKTNLILHTYINSGTSIIIPLLEKDNKTLSIEEINKIMDLYTEKQPI